MPADRTRHYECKSTFRIPSPAGGEASRDLETTGAIHATTTTDQAINIWNSFLKIVTGKATLSFFWRRTMNVEKLLVFPLLAIGCHLVLAGAVDRDRRDTAWKITTILDPPYTKKTVDIPANNDDFEGYIPDLLKKIGSHLGQSYTIAVVADGKYGAKDGDRWTGMIGEVVSGKADIAAAAITVSEARKEVVSFTDPWKQIKSVIVIKKPADGSESKVKSAEDLAAQSDVKYVAVKDGTTLQLIQNATEPPYIVAIKKQQDPIQLVSTSDEGIRKVKKGDGKFAFITESATGYYWAKRKPCDLIVLEIPLPEKSYAFAVAKDSSIKERLNGAIKAMKASGEFDKITDNWWKDECSGGGALFCLESVLVPLVVVLLASLLSSN